MDYYILQLIRKHFRHIIFWILLFISPAIFGINGDPGLKTITDSLRNEILKCSNDTARFKVLYNYFWKYANYDLERVKSVGEWAFNEIKNSKNLRALSDGYDIKGFIYRDEENYDSAFFYFGRALESAKKVGYKTRIAWSYYHLGELNYLFGNFKSALDYMKYSVRYFTEVDNYSGEAGSIYYISDMYDRMGIPDSAILFNNKRLAIFKNHSDTIGKIVSNLAISSFYKNHSDSRKSLDYLKSALREAESMNNAQPVVKVYFAIGDFFAEQKKNYSIANDYYARVLEFAERKNEKSLEAQLLNQIGNIYMLEDKDSLALKFNLKSLAIAQEVKHRHTISNAYNSLGLVYKKLGNYNSALNCFNSCYSIGCNKCPAIAFHQTLIEIGDIYLTLNDLEQSLSWYRKSLNLAEKFHSLKDISVSNLRIGNCYQKLNRQGTAESYYLQSYRTAKEAGDISLIRSIADTTSHFYAHRNEYSLAYRYKQLSTELGDSLNEINRQADITELEMKFEVEKIKKDNEARQTVAAVELKRQKALKNYFTVFSILLVGYGFAVYSGYRRKKKDNKLLTIRKIKLKKRTKKSRHRLKKLPLRKTKSSINGIQQQEFLQENQCAY